MPQLENGYTKIADELLEALARINIPGRARQIFDAILRKTYGFGKKEDMIALSQFEAMTGMRKQHICREINKLEAMNLITRNGHGIITKYGINKHYSEWESLPDRATLPNTVKSLPDKGHTIKTSTIKKKKKTKRFQKPSLKEVDDYCKERGNNIDPGRFVDYYEANGWKAGKNPMKDWKATVRNWERNHKERQTETDTQHHTGYGDFEDQLKEAGLFTEPGEGK